MSFSSAGCDAMEFALKYSCGSFASSKDLARPRPSSKAALAALKFRVDRRSKAANCEVARARMASTLALFALVTCSGVMYMIDLQGVRGGWHQRRLQRQTYCTAAIGSSTEEGSHVKRNLCNAIPPPGKYKG